MKGGAEEVSHLLQTGNQAGLQEIVYDVISLGLLMGRYGPRPKTQLQFWYVLINHNVNRLDLNSPPLRQEGVEDVGVLVQYLSNVLRPLIQAWNVFH